MKTSLKTRIVAAVAISVVAASVAATATARPEGLEGPAGFGSSPGSVARPDDRGGKLGIGTSATSASAASHYSKQALAAMGGRYKAMAAYYGKPAASYYSTAALAAMGQRYQAQADALAIASASKAGPPRPDDRGGVLGPGPEPFVVTVHSTGFDWRDATIGFVTAAGCAMLLAAAGAAAATRRRHGAATAS